MANTNTYTKRIQGFNGRTFTMTYEARGDEVFTRTDGEPWLRVAHGLTSGQVAGFHAQMTRNGYA